MFGALIDNHCVVKHFDKAVSLLQSFLLIGLQKEFFAENMFIYLLQ